MSLLAYSLILRHKALEGQFTNSTPLLRKEGQGMVDNIRGFGASGGGHHSPPNTYTSLLKKKGESSPLASRLSLLTTHTARRAITACRAVALLFPQMKQQQQNRIYFLPIGLYHYLIGGLPPPMIACTYLRLNL